MMKRVEQFEERLRIWVYRSIDIIMLGSDSKWTQHLNYLNEKADKFLKVVQ